MSNTFLGLPISTSQAMVGAITGIGPAVRNLSVSGLVKVVICWIATPVGAMIFSVIIYYLLKLVLGKLRLGVLNRDKILWGGLVIVGIYGSYALGANNVANATGIYSGLIPGLTNFHLSLIGAGWILTPLVAFLLSAAGYAVFL